jgi:4-amino-4-deoxy-L-arabinose transferase-like glycosyltransferase
MDSVSPSQSTDGDAAPTHVPELAHEQPANTFSETESTYDLLRATNAMLGRMDARLNHIEAQLQPAAPAARPPLPILAGTDSSRIGWFQLMTLLTLALVIFVRLYNLDRLQNEIFGDIALVFDYLAGIRAGRWPFHFTLSLGPLYQYVITPVILATGMTYFGLKLASVLVSLGVLAATYALATRLLDKRFGLLATLIAGVSSWLLVFSRLGNAQILVPLLTISALWLALRASEGGSIANVVACAAIATLGLYVYPPSFILSPVIGLTLLCLCWTGMNVRWKDLFCFALVTLICALPFAWIVSRDPYNFFSGYIGSKLESQDNPFSILLRNLVHGLLALHVYGDSVSRTNPNSLPLLDVVSGLLFLGGLAFWLLPAQRQRSPLLLVPLVLLQLPSLLVLSRPHEVPSASRTLGVAPIVYILVASGLWWLAQLVRARLPRWVTLALVLTFLTAIVLLNERRYFQEYVNGLPYQNTPVGQLIARYIDSLPPDTQVYMVGCCWQDSMPEPNAVIYATLRPERFHVLEPTKLNCDWLTLTPPPTVLVWSFHTPLPTPQLDACSNMLPAQLYTSQQGLPVFYAATLFNNQVVNAATAPGAEGLESSIVTIDGQTANMNFSSLDMGEVGNLFDHQVETLIRGKGANPLILDIQLSQPRRVSTISMTLATMQHAQIQVEVTSEDGSTTRFSRDLIELSGMPDVELPIPNAPIQTRHLRIEVLDLAPPGGDGPHIHVRELQLR